MNIYYAAACEVDVGLRLLPPQRVLNDFPRGKVGGINICPALKHYLDNMFYISAPFDYNIKYSVEEKIVRSDYYSQSEFNKLIKVRDIDSGLISFNMFYFFITEEKSLEISMIPAHMYSNGFTSNSTLIPGTFDIGKWPRPLECAFFIDRDIDIKEGNPLYFIKFNTSKQINFKRFLVTDKYLKLNDITANVRQYKKCPFKDLQAFYNYSLKYPKIKKLLLKEVKDNLL